MPSPIGSRLLFRFLSTTAAAAAAGKLQYPLISLIRSSTSPNEILHICQSHNLTPSTHPHRLALVAAVTTLSSLSSPDTIRSLLHTPHFPPNESILLFARANLLPDAFRTFSLHPPSVRTLNALLFACVLSNNHALVENTFRSLSRQHRLAPDLTTYNTVIKALCHTNSSRSVFALLDEMWRRGVKPNATSYNTLIAGLYREDKPGEVSRVLDLMKSNNCSRGISTENTRIQSLCKLNRTGEALELLEKMKVRGMKPNSVTYHHIIHGFCREGRQEETKRAFEEMERMGCVADRECYSTMVHYLCKGGNFEEGLRFCRRSMERNWVPRFGVMRELVEGLVRGGRVEEGKQLTEEVKRRFSGKVWMWEEVEDGLLMSSSEKKEGGDCSSDL